MPTQTPITDYAVELAWFQSQLAKYPCIAYVDAAQSNKKFASTKDLSRYCESVNVATNISPIIRMFAYKTEPSSIPEKSGIYCGWFWGRGWPPGFEQMEPIRKIDYMQAVHDIVGRG